MLVGFVWDWASVARGEGFVPLSKVLIPPRGGLAEIAGYMMGCHINDNPNGQNEEDTEGSPKVQTIQAFSNVITVI